MKIRSRERIFDNYCASLSKSFPGRKIVSYSWAWNFSLDGMYTDCGVHAFNIKQTFSTPGSQLRCLFRRNVY
jgi:hypothetical protein